MASALDLNSTDGVVAFERFLAAGSAATEAGLQRCAEPAMARWLQRGRAGVLARDAAPVTLRGPAEGWGALYVLEGSRLGGRMLVQRHKRLAELPFFWDVGAREAWPAFLADLEAADGRHADREAMVRGAQKAFAAFVSGRTARCGTAAPALSLPPAMALEGGATTSRWPGQ